MKNKIHFNSKLSILALGLRTVHHMSIEFYGFAIYIGAFVGSAIWLVWSFAPEFVLKYFGILYYPSKYWAATIPSIIIVSYISWFILYSLSVLILTQPRNIAASYKDSNSKSIILPTASISTLYDVPISDVNYFLDRGKTK